jgi:ABC-type multidrug transport system fused ATPase/permease subunit
MNPGGMHLMHSYRKDESVLKHKMAPGTVRRVLRFGRPYAAVLALFLFLVALDAATGVVNPLTYRQLINRGILLHDVALVVRLAFLAAGVSVVDAALTYAQRTMATKIGLEIVLDLRKRVFAHVQEMSLAFFGRTRTGAMVGRLNSDASGVSDAFTDILSTAIGNVVTVALVLTAMFVLSWRLTLAGAVRMNGRDLRDATMESIRATVGMVMQDAHLFHDTLRANLLYARPDASDAELTAALRDAQILSLVEGLPHGLDTVIGERGHRLSGGERQRVAIARLLVKAPPVVILDEATAHLDSESERAIQLAFRSALAGRTALVIAHRLSTVRNADLILVLDRGRIVERGRHDELLEAGQRYAQLYKTQFSAAPASGEAAVEDAR